MWDGLLEARIRLQKVLLLCNRIPQHDSLEAFKTVGGQPLEEAQRESECRNSLPFFFPRIVCNKDVGW